MAETHLHDARIWWLASGNEKNHISSACNTCVRFCSFSHFANAVQRFVFGTFSRARETVWERLVFIITHIRHVFHCGSRVLFHSLLVQRTNNSIFTRSPLAVPIYSRSMPNKVPATSYQACTCAHTTTHKARSLAPNALNKLCNHIFLYSRFLFAQRHSSRW